MKKEWREAMQKAAITVEASFLVPWTVLLIALLMTITFYMHNRTWYTAAALEASLAGNQYIPGASGSGRAGRSGSGSGENPAGAQKAARSAEIRIRDQAMPGTAPEKIIRCSNERTAVSFSGQRFLLFSEALSWQVEEEAKKIRPAPVLRDKWALQEIWNAATKEGGDG